MRPTQEQIDAAKAECRKRFGHERVIGIPLGAPINLFVIMAAFGMREAAEYVDARAASPIQARSALVVERCLFPEAKVLADVRRLRGALDLKIEESFRGALGWNDAAAVAQPFSAATAPPGFAALADVAAKAADLLEQFKHTELWSVTNPANGLALVMAGPEEEVFIAAVAAIQDANRTKRGGLTTVLTYARDLIVWSPRPLDQYLDEAPGRAEDLANPFLEIGGAGATASASFL